MGHPPEGSLRRIVGECRQTGSYVTSKAYFRVARHSGVIATTGSGNPGADLPCVELASNASLTHIDCLVHHLAKRNMLRGDIGRTIVAVMAGYAANAVLVAATEHLLLRLIPNTDYFVADLITQCLYGIAGGYLSCLIAKRCKRWTAAVGLMGLGLLVGTISLITSWKMEPHWYGIALLSAWVPCVWIGYFLERRVSERNSSAF